MSEHYFTEKPQSTFKKEEFIVRMFDQEFKITSGSGLFAIKNLDFGSNLLIANAQIPKDNAKILDLGCGYGVIGLLIKYKHPSTEMWMCDINERAVKLSMDNCENNNVECNVVKSDVFSNPQIHKEKFDVILTNPPFSAGRELCKRFIYESYHHLNKEGVLELVAPHNKGGDVLKAYMLEIFGNSGELAKKSGFRVYISKKTQE